MILELIAIRYVQMWSNFVSIPSRDFMILEPTTYPLKVLNYQFQSLVGIS